MSFLKEDVLKHFSFLFNTWNFVFIESEVEFNGNVVVAQSGDFRVRFIWDRNDFFLDFACAMAPGHWMPFYTVLDRLRTEGSIKKTYKYSNKITVVSGLLKQYFPLHHAQMLQVVKLGK